MTKYTDNLEDSLAIEILSGDVIEAKHIIAIRQPHDIKEWCMHREYVLAAYVGQKVILSWIELTWHEALERKINEMKEKENIDKDVVLDRVLKHEMQSRMEMVDEALVSATSNKHVDVVEFLIDECGADYNTSYSGNILNECMIDTLKNGNLDLFKTILGIDPNVLNFVGSKGNRPLMIAASNGSFEIVKYLLSIGHNIKKVELDKLDKDGKTILMVAVEDSRKDSNLDIVKIFHSKDADLGIRNKEDNKSAYHYCDKTRNPNLMKFLDYVYTDYPDYIL